MKRGDPPRAPEETPVQSQFGTTGDFFIVARATINAPIESNGCHFHYLTGKLGFAFRTCASSTGPVMAGGLTLSTEVDVGIPQSLSTSFGVLSFGRNLSGSRMEVSVANVVAQQSIGLTDVSGVGTPFGVGGDMDGSVPFGAYNGNVNRLYVYHAPPGTFTASDFDMIRAFVASAPPVP